MIVSVQPRFSFRNNNSAEIKDKLINKCIADDLDDIPSINVTKMTVKYFFECMLVIEESQTMPTTLNYTLLILATIKSICTSVN